MIKDNLEKFENILHTAIKRHLVKKKKILVYQFQDAHGNACPIGIVTGTSTTDYRQALIDKIGFYITNDELLAFLRGFMGYKYDDLDTKLFELGKQFRKEYV